MKLRKSLIAGLSISSLLLASACSGGAEKTEKEAAGDSKGKVVVELWHTYSDQEEKVMKEQVEPLFEKTHPNIDLKLTRMPYEGLKQQVIAGVSGGATPDLMRMDIVWVPEFAKMGALAEVDSLDGFNEIKNNVFEAPLSTNFYQGKYYGLPLNTNTKIAIYNKALLAKAGLTEPPKTMDELAAASKKIVESGGKGGIGISGTASWSWLPYFWSLGGKLSNEDYTRFDGYVNSPESVAAVEKIAAWQKDKLVSPTLLNGQPGTWDGIKNNQYLMVDDGPWFYSTLMNDKKEKNNPMDYTVRGLIPEGPGGSHSVIGGEDLVMFKNSKHPKEAWEVAKWLLTEEPQKLMSQTGIFPTNKAVANSEEFQKVPFVKEYVQQLDTALPRTPVPQWNEIDAILTKNFEKVVRNKMSAKDAMDDAAKKIEAVMKK